MGLNGSWLLILVLIEAALLLQVEVNEGRTTWRYFAASSRTRGQRLKARASLPRAR